MTEHKHNHEHSCDCGHNHYTPSREPLDVNELDTGGKALANALRVSFVLLKFIMIVLVIAYFASGIYTIEPDWQGLVLRFGKIVGTPQDRVRQPGLGWCWPAPVDEVIKFPVKMQQTVEMGNEFWYMDEQNGYPGKTLRPESDGYCLTRNEPLVGVTGNDYNIIHCKWEIKYHIADIAMFFKNIYIQKLQTGEDFYDVKEKSVDPVIKVFASDAIVSTLVHYNIDDALTISKNAIAEDVKKEIVRKLGTIESGISIDAVLLTSITWPRQVGDAFLASTKAQLDRDKEVTNAKTYADTIVNEAGGRNARMIVESLDAPDANEQYVQQLWDNIAGQSKEIITQAQTYRTRTIESARANAIYLEKLLPEYRKRPELVLQKIYQDAIQDILQNVDEKIFIQPATGGSPREIRLMVSRDYSPKKDSKQQ